MTTSLREHRGDGHVAVLCADGLDPCAVLVLFARSEGLDDELLRPNRGWSTEEWERAAADLFDDGLLGTTGVTEAEASRRDEIEATTDALAASLFDDATEPEITAMAERLGAIAADVARHGVVPYPNPMGLPPPPGG